MGYKLPSLPRSPQTSSTFLLLLGAGVCSARAAAICSLAAAISCTHRAFAVQGKEANGGGQRCREASSNGNLPRANRTSNRVLDSNFESRLNPLLLKRRGWKWAPCNFESRFKRSSSLVKGEPTIWFSANICITRERTKSYTLL